MLTNGYPSTVFLQLHRYYAITFSWIKYSYSHCLSCTTLLRWKNLHVSTLPCSDNLIFTYAFRCLLWACVLDDACNIIGNFINASFTLPHTRRIFATTTFLLYSWFRPVHSEIRQWIRFSTYSPSTSGQLSTAWPVWTIFCRLQRASDPWNSSISNACRSIRGSVSGRYSVIPLLRLSVLLRI